MRTEMLVAFLGVLILGGKSGAGVEERAKEPSPAIHSVAQQKRVITHEEATFLVGLLDAYGVPAATSGLGRQLTENRIPSERERSMFHIIADRVANVVTGYSSGDDEVDEIHVVQTAPSGMMAHADNRKWSDTEGEWIPNHSAWRTWSASMGLTDAGVGYNGGALEVAGVKHRLSVGDIVVFPASTLHSVDPVISGTRCVMLVWLRKRNGHISRNARTYRSWLRRCGLERLERFAADLFRVSMSLEPGLLLREEQISVKSSIARIPDAVLQRVGLTLIDIRKIRGASRERDC